MENCIENAPIDDATSCAVCIASCARKFACFMHKRDIDETTGEITRGWHLKCTSLCTRECLCVCVCVRFYME